MWWVVPLLVLVAPPPPALPATDFCALCRRPGSHTLCRFPRPGPAPACSGYVPAPLTPAERAALLDAHNGLRSRVALGQGWSPNSTHDAQPKAADMRQLYWDDELAATAQRWADRCDSFFTDHPHDECRDSARFPVGQNVVTSAYSRPLPVAPDVRARVRDWYAELDDFDPAWAAAFSLQPAPGRPTAHYTQLVWGWTFLLGCGRAVFHEVIQGEVWTVERLVCNYGPSGNFLGLPLYRQGQPCSSCPDGTRCSGDYPGLCQVDDSYNGTTTPLPPLWSFTTRPADASTSRKPTTAAPPAAATPTTRATTLRSFTTRPPDDSTSKTPATTAPSAAATPTTRATPLRRVTTTTTTTTTTPSADDSDESGGVTDAETTTEAEATTEVATTTEVVTTTEVAATTAEAATTTQQATTPAAATETPAENATAE